MSRVARIRLATFVDASTRNEHCGNRKGSKSGKQLIRATRHVCWFEFANSTKDGHGDGADRHGYSNLQKAGDIFADLSAREAEFCLDLHGNNGPGRIAVNQSALVETLIQLSDFRQYDKAESLLSACTREQLEQLHAISDRAFSKRLTYSLEKQLKRSSNGTNKVKGLILVKLMKILNAWCMEGHRPAIRCVLAAMKGQELLMLASLSDLDREVYSMLREFEPLYESTPCDCLH